MKKVFFCFLAAFLFAACNNDKTADKGASAAAATPDEKKADASPAGCGALVWFKEGTVLEYEVKGMSKPVHTVTTINKVHKDGASLVADYTSELDNGKKLNASYHCEGSKLYVDMKALFNDLMGGMKVSGIDVEVNDSRLIFPWDMKEGDDLDESVFQLTGKRNGKEFMTM